MLFGQPKLIQPFGDVALRLGGAVVAQGEALQYRGVRFGAPNGSDSVGETVVPGGDKRNDGLAAEIVFVQEAVNRHGHIVPPVGEAQENGIIAIQILDMRGQPQAGIGAFLP